MILNFLGRLGRIDKTLFISVVVLVLLGAVVIFSTSYSVDGVDLLNFKKQLVFSVIGIVLMTFISFFDYRALKNYTGLLYVLACFILIAVLFSGSLVRGTASWFSFGFFSFQPSEFVKIVIIIVMAKYLANAEDHALKRIVTSGIYTFLLVILIILQPDLGSSLALVFVWFSMLAVSGVRKKYIIIILLLGLVAFAGSWSFVLEGYQKERVVTFLNPQLDPLGSGYNVIQSIIAVGSGNMWGKGLGYGSQSQLNFLPEKHTDFIFAVIAEEMGFIGVLLLLGLFAVVLHRLFKIAIEAQDNFGKFLLLGISFVLIFHIVVNIGMNMGVMPVTGIPLPFISYGGSSLISFLVMIGVAQSVYVKGRGYRLEKDEESNI
jgi:rod shape determining protein RodA